MNRSVSFLSLNIENPSLERAKKQCEWLVNRSEDIIMLTETKNSQGCLYIEEYFQQYGYDLLTFDSPIRYDVYFPKSQTGDLGVMIISKLGLMNNSNFFDEKSRYYARQIKSVLKVEKELLNVIGLYVPSRDRSETKVNRKKVFIDNIEQFLEKTVAKKTIILGDLNIVDRGHMPHYSTYYEWEYEFYDKILDANYIDAYKYCNDGAQDYSWVGRTNNGYRYDYCFVSSDLKERVIECKFLHETRLSRITDHSAITMTMKI